MGLLSKAGAQGAAFNLLNAAGDDIEYSAMAQIERERATALANLKQQNALMLMDRAYGYKGAIAERESAAKENVANIAAGASVKGHELMAGAVTGAAGIRTAGRSADVATQQAGANLRNAATNRTRMGVASLIHNQSAASGNVPLPVLKAITSDAKSKMAEYDRLHKAELEGRGKSGVNKQSAINAAQSARNAYFNSTVMPNSIKAFGGQYEDAVKSRFGVGGEAASVAPMAATSFNAGASNYNGGASMSAATVKANAAQLQSLLTNPNVKPDVVAQAVQRYKAAGFPQDVMDTMLKSTGPGTAAGGGANASPSSAGITQKGTPEEQMDSVLSEQTGLDAQNPGDAQALKALSDAMGPGEVPADQSGDE